MDREQQIVRIFTECGASDKLAHQYASVYATIPEDIGSVLELGVSFGFSLMSWLRVFPAALVCGVDIDLSLMNLESTKSLQSTPRVKLVQADIRTFDLSSLPDSDLIIDDCTHQTEDILRAWELLRRKARVAYVIEDLTLAQMREVWDYILPTVSSHQMIFWRTSECDGRYQHAEGDSHCLIIRP